MVSRQCLSKRDIKGMIGRSEIDAERVAREKAAWDAGVDRRRLEDILARSAGIWSEDVDRIITNAFADYYGGKFLEIGSASWASWIHRLKTPVGSVECINISDTEIQNGRDMAAGTEVKPTFKVMDAHSLDYDDASFDVVFGKAILHHLDYVVALDEIDRVLKPGGLMVFMEPLDLNPVGWLVRAVTPDMRTPDEVPMRLRHLRLFKERFDVTFHPVELASLPLGVTAGLLNLKKGGAFERATCAFDRLLLKIPGLRLCARSVMIVGKKKTGP